jgi:hypothetical protein
MGLALQTLIQARVRATGSDDGFTGLFQIVPVFAFPALSCRTFLR